MNSRWLLVPLSVCYGFLPSLFTGCLLLAQTSALTPPEIEQQNATLPSQQARSAVPGSIAGQVIDADGAVVKGARASLVVSSGTLQSLTDASGRFFFRDISPGPYSLSITLPGFNTALTTGNLQPGQTLDVPRIALSVGTVKITINAMTEEQISLEQLHTEEHQRLIGVLPNFFVSYSWTAPPLTTRQKFTLSWKNASDPGNLALSATVAGLQQAQNTFPGYHQGAAGYGKRFGADYANLWTGTFMGGAVLPTLFRQDPRYFYKGTGTFRSRFFYAISRAVICRGDNGRWQPNFSGVLGDLSAGAISNIYYPASNRQGARLTIENGFLGVAGDAMNGFVQEFVLSHFTTKGKKDQQP